MSSTTSDATVGTSQKNRACIPCHERKVKCNVTHSGTPCTRCVKHGRTAACQLVPLPDRSARRLKRLQRRPKSNLREQVLQEQTPCAPLGSISALTDREGQSEAKEIDQSRDPIGVVEEDVQLETCLRMAEPENERYNLIPGTPGTTPAKEFYAYYGGIDSTTILGQVMSLKASHEFVRILLRDPKDTCSASGNLNAKSIEYLQSVAAFDLPPPHACQELVRLYFERAFPYIPVLNRISFMEQFSKRTCSTFLLQCIFTSVAPYMGADQLAECGYSHRAQAQKAFFSKAQILYDLGAVKSQVHLLQGSLILTSSYHSFGHDKDCRYWLSNAVRIATQMGLHRKHIANQLEGETRKLFVRIFWTMYSRDIIMTMAGRMNVRVLDERYCDIPEVTEDDWEDESGNELASYGLPPVSMIQKSYLVYSSRLAQICAQYNEMFKRVDISPTYTACNKIENDYLAWKRALPSHLQYDNVDEWSHENIWILVLRAMGFRLECLLYREMQKIAGNPQNDASRRAARKQQNAMLEFDVIIGRFMLHDLVEYCPFSMTTCASTILAMHIECLFNRNSTESQRRMSQASIQSGLDYLRASLQHWESLRWSLRMFDVVVSKLKILSGSDLPARDSSAGSMLRQEASSTGKPPGQRNATDIDATLQRQEGELAWSSTSQSLMFPFVEPGMAFESMLLGEGMEGDFDGIHVEDLFGDLSTWAGGALGL